MNKFRTIGLSGLAGAGKDMFFTLLQKQLPTVERFALADALKDEINPTLKALYGIDIFTCPRETKDLVRPMLVAHGSIRRRMTQGKYWTNLLQQKIQTRLREKPDVIPVVTDIRYDVYPHDEVQWMKETMGGALVHISLFTENANGQRVFIQPPNLDEAENDPKLQRQSDFRVIWPKLLNAQNQTPDWEQLSTYAEACIKFLNR